MKLRNQVVWITGSSRGIGKSAAQTLAAKGARVVISARQEEDAAEVAGEINANGDAAIAVRCDVRDNADIIAVVQQTQELWGNIDILINNAGVGIFKKIVETSADEWEQMMQTNLTSAYLCTRAVLPGMIARGRGHIINVVSVAGIQPFDQCGGYCASKYGLLGFTEVLRMETRKFGIQVTALIPGATDTDIWAASNFDRKLMMKPDAVADAIVSICQLDDSALIETLVMRPRGGDL